MELYTLDDQMLLKDSIDDFSSAIWTERYSSAGDVKLVLPATNANVSRLAEGSFLSLSGSKEIMLIDTQSIENEMLTVSGSSLLAFLDERSYRFGTDTTAQNTKFTGTVPDVIATIVVTSAIGFTLAGAPIVMPGLGSDNKIPNLTLDTYDSSGTSSDYVIQFGSVYTTIKTLASDADVGIKLYLAATNTGFFTGGYSLKFSVYRGRDLTSGQTTNPLVRFSPDLDSLTNVKEVRSTIGYKNVAYAYATNITTGDSTPRGVAYVDDGATALGFSRRVLLIFVSDIPEEAVGVDADAPAKLLSLLNQKAKDALANNNYTRVLDGEVVPQADYQYGVHYDMGDIVELEGYSGFTQKARVTEYIRTQDSTGERAYPTVSVIE